MTETERRAWRRLPATLAIGGLGAALFWLIGFPMPFLTGPAALVTLAALRGVPMAVPTPARNLCFLVLGLNIGASVTPEVLETAAQWPASLALLTGLLVVSMVSGTKLLERGFGFDRTSALLGATPGHLSFVLGLTVDRQLDLDRIAVVQSVRVLVLTLLLPIPLVLMGGTEALFPGGARPMTPASVLILLAASVAVGLIFKRLRVPAPYLLAAMAVSGLGHATALTPGAPPPGLAEIAFVAMGCIIGTRFNGIALDDLRRSALAGLAVTGLFTALALAGAVMLGVSLGIDPRLLFIAYAPGGLEAMAAMSVQLGLAPAVVAAHHVLRLVILSVLIPVFLARLPPPPAQS